MEQTRVPITKELLDKVNELSRRDRIAYWHSRTLEERLQAMELMRQIAYEYDPATARMERVLEFGSLDNEA